MPYPHKILRLDLSSSNLSILRTLLDLRYQFLLLILELDSFSVQFSLPSSSAPSLLPGIATIPVSSRVIFDVSAIVQQASCAYCSAMLAVQLIGESDARTQKPTPRCSF